VGLWTETNKLVDWRDDVNVVRICVELLHTLAVWLTDASCKHHFINSCCVFKSRSDEVAEIFADFLSIMWLVVLTCFGFLLPLCKYQLSVCLSFATCTALCRINVFVNQNIVLYCIVKTANVWKSLNPIAEDYDYDDMSNSSPRISIWQKHK